MNSRQIRQTFLDFFASKQHQVVPSAPMVVKNDPTLMFTNAGMNQFKDYFLGNEEAPFKRAADTQKCLRVSGKHNDLEEVGVDTYHHTMFEMLGNWSFGNYFKEEAINWAWELLTGVYKINPENIYVTVFEGDADDNLPPDTEAETLWNQHLPTERILRFGKKDNFWEMGDTGPCGPCTEIHVDVRPDPEKAAVPGKTLVNASHPQVIEIWNLVFMQFNRQANGSLNPLPARHVDTGMGFERLAMVLQGKQSNYDTDIFQPLIARLSSLSGKAYTGANERTDVALRVCADHIRAVAFSIADGQLPSNSGAGYVIRRILRRAIRYGYSFLGFETPFMYKLVEVLAQEMGHQFPELRNQRELCEKVIREEEEAFLRTLSKGIQRFQEHAAKHSGVLDGQFVFELYDTFGFPPDLTALLAQEADRQIDHAGFNEALKAQKARSRAATTLVTGDWVSVGESGENTRFVGYDHLECEVRILRYRKVDQKGKTFFQLVLDQTPFYAEGGGQVGDTGTLSSLNERIEIADTRRENNLWVHHTSELPENVSATFVARVDSRRRMNTARNHTATHLLHLALRQQLGTHVEQKGSLVHPDYLRFDFSHYQKVEALELATLEREVNRFIRANLPLQENRAMPIEEALVTGAMALFGEKYGNTVRVVRFGDSVELCGGTHLPATGATGTFKIVSEAAVAAGVRRIEAVTGEAAEQFIDDKLNELEQIKGLLKAPRALKAVEDLVASQQQLKQQVEAQAAKNQQALANDLRNAINALPQDKLRVVVKRLDADAAALKNIVWQVRQDVSNAAVVLGSVTDDKPALVVMVTDDALEQGAPKATEVIKKITPFIQGGGGGQPFLATAGGKNASGLAEALGEAQKLLSHLGS